MKYFLVALAVLSVGTVAIRADQTPNVNQMAIQKAIDSYVAAFNKADAKALADHWTDSGQLVTPGGKTLQGHSELEKEFAAYFADTKNAKLELAGTTINLLSPNVALENGTARVLVPQQEPSETQYEAIHVKKSTGWKIDSVREEIAPAPPPTHYEQLEKLEWMIGQWVDADDHSTVEVNCRWTSNRNFLVRSFKVLIKDRLDLEGTQVIGWDPAAQTIRSWMFDSDGGFGVGRWNRDGNRWTVQTLNILSDGRRASATNLYEVVDEKTVRFQSIGRQVGGELLPNIATVNLVRTAGK